MNFVERGEIMVFFRSAKNIVFIAVIFVLVVALAVTTVVLFRRGSAYNDAYLAASAELETTKSQLQSAESKNSSYAAELEGERNEKKRLEEENKGLKSEIEKLKAKKKAEEEARRLALKKQQEKQKLQQLSQKQNAATVPATKVCYLTFDDGPNQNTLKILEILARYNVRATFFVKGSANVTYLKNIQAGGHAIGLHTYSHVYSDVYASDEAYFNDLSRVSAVIEKHTGIKSMLVRFPGGSSNTASKKYCNKIMTRVSQGVTEKGYKYFDWNVDSGDAAGYGASRIQSAVLTQAANRSGPICVLMHDIHKTTVNALPGVIEGLKKQGFSFAALTTSSPGFHHPIKN